MSSLKFAKAPCSILSCNRWNDLTEGNGLQFFAFDVMQSIFFSNFTTLPETNIALENGGLQ